MTQEIFYLSEYNWEKGILISEGKVNYKIHIPGSSWMKARDVRVAKEKCAMPTEAVCVVWETWRGKNGRGTYRVECELYPNHRVPADQMAYQSYGAGRVTEKMYGIER